MGLGEAELACAQPHRDDEGDRDGRSDPCYDAPRPMCLCAAVVGLAKAGVPGTGAWAAVWGAGAPTLLPDRSVPQALQNRTPLGFLAPQLGQNMGASRHCGAGSARAACAMSLLRFYTPGYLRRKQGPVDLRANRSRRRASLPWRCARPYRACRWVLVHFWYWNT